jgi:hypothetical protein
MENKLDLHRISHSAVRRLTIRFIEDTWMNEENIFIVTGHSKKMKEIVCEVLDEYGLKYYIGGRLGIFNAIIEVVKS